MLSRSTVFSISYQSKSTHVLYFNGFESHVQLKGVYIACSVIFHIKIGGRLHTRFVQTNLEG